MNQAVKVGLFMAVVLAILGYLIMQVEHIRLFGPEGQRVEAAFDSVAGLDNQAAVRIAGVRIGRVDGIRLDGQRAVVSLLLEEPVELTAGTTAAIANMGLLGDKYVVLELGPAGGPTIPEGTILAGETPVGFDDAMAKLNELGDSIQGAVGSLSGGDGDSALSRLITNLELTSAEIRSLVATNRTQVTATVDNFSRFSAALAEELPKLTRQIESVLAQVDGVVGENRENLRESLASVREASAGLKTSVDNLNTISTKIADGDGTIGKLVNSDEAHDSMVAALGSVEAGADTLTETLGRVRDLKLDVGFNSYYLEELEDTRTAFSLDLQPNDSRFYHVAFVDDPRGRTRAETRTITTTFDDGTTETETVREVKVEEKITISAQFGFRLGDANLRAGLFESTGGAAIDYGVFDQRLWLTLEAFDFSREDDLDPRARFTTRWNLNENAYLLGGYDDFLVDGQESVFFGAGFTWNDDDLKYLLGSVPSGF